MLTHARPAVAPRSAPPSLPLQPPDRWAALLDSLGAIEDEENVIVLGRGGSDLMCALMRAGAPQVTHLLTHERLEAESASLVIVPQMTSLDLYGNRPALDPARAGARAAAWRSASIHCQPRRTAFVACCHSTALPRCSPLAQRVARCSAPRCHRSAFAGPPEREFHDDAQPHLRRRRLIDRAGHTLRRHTR